MLDLITTLLSACSCVPDEKSMKELQSLTNQFHQTSDPSDQQYRETLRKTYQLNQQFREREANSPSTLKRKIKYEIIESTEVVNFTENER